MAPAARRTGLVILLSAGAIAQAPTIKDAAS
jgi:hypothetical protein